MPPHHGLGSGSVQPPGRCAGPVSDVSQQCVGDRQAVGPFHHGTLVQCVPYNNRLGSRDLYAPLTAVSAATWQPHLRELPRDEQRDHSATAQEQSETPAGTWVDRTMRTVASRGQFGRSGRSGRFGRFAKFGRFGQLEHVGLHPSACADRAVEPALLDRVIDRSPHD